MAQLLSKSKKKKSVGERDEDMQDKYLKKGKKNRDWKPNHRRSFWVASFRFTKDEHASILIDLQ